MGIIRRGYDAICRLYGVLRRLDPGLGLEKCIWTSLYLARMGLDS